MMRDSDAVESRPGDHGLAAATGDLAAVAGFALVAGSLLLADVVTGPAQVALAAVLLGFAPGYATVSALFPARGVLDPARRRTRWVRGPNWVERLSLSVATSLVLVVLLGVPISLLGLDFGARTLTVAVVAVVAAGALLGAWRRLRLPSEDRLVVPVARLRAEAKASTVDVPAVDAALNVALAVAVVAAASALAVGLAAPDRGEAYTEVALLDDRGGDLVASNYTTSIERGDPANVTLTVENREGESREYTAVLVLQRVRTTDGQTVVLEREELDRIGLSVPDERTAERTLTARPTMLGDDLRMNVFVYPGDAPSEASASSAPHHLFLWVDVQRASAGNASASAAGSASPSLV
ncbi:DUF1616 domain-containing protein [Halobacterium litoreum]|uniref:DUF1616 domain-containing protein n=1 Tax=Halobacterium litoreum TaxID=2039234 RepID=A0ABD5NBC9_9EURY|nr:DUF1616 domain-containing protein [Halobacterium litoreum]UHH14673.1 DUF1616 domain-containing protein [Halobacterium litoreum]